MVQGCGVQVFLLPDLLPFQLPETIVSLFPEFRGLPFRHPEEEEAEAEAAVDLGQVGEETLLTGPMVDPVEQPPCRVHSSLFL